MRPTLGVVFLCALALAGCGDDESDDPATTVAGLEADLRVAVRPQGQDGPARERTIRCEELGARPEPCRKLAGLRSEALAPVPRDVACTEIYGGPATATVDGTVRGEPVHASFSLMDGCEIARWRRNAALLGEPPGNPPG